MEITMSLYRFLFIFGLIVIGLVVVWKIAPAKSKLIVLRQEPHFPVVSGFNLDRQESTFPGDFLGKYNLVIIPFQQYQQGIVNTWIPKVQEIEATYPQFAYYELPTIYEMSLISRTFLNEGMRAGIPDQTARERTITLYLDKEKFKSALDIPNEDQIYLFLVDRNGDIHWRETGSYNPDKTSELIGHLQRLQEGNINLDE
jgi:hypothetical protein